jgi:hypothetical protein
MLAVILILVATPRAAEWTVAPRLSFSGGDESDLILDPNVDGEVVAAGSFLDLRPELVVRRVGASGRLRLSTAAVLERYLNSENRRVYAQSVVGEFAHFRSDGMRTRLFASFDFFDDSNRPTVRRYGGGAGLGAGWIGRRVGVEATASWNGRRYPDLLSPDATGLLDTYSESSWGVGANVLIAAGRWLWRPEFGLRWTSARDPLYESQSRVLALNGQCALGSRLVLLATALHQARDFSQRLPGEDSDEFLQAGAGLDLELRGDTRLLARWSLVRYTRATGGDEDTHRMELGLRYDFGAGPARAEPTWRPAGPALASIDSPESAGRLRFHLPGASHVQLAGDFNGWNPTSHPLTRQDGGWWEIDLDLEPGIYQYKLVVDGEWVLPEDVERRVDDGFGGQNAVLVIPGESW